jgi:hypothetical protein
LAVPTWIVGQVLTASDVNTWFVPIAAVTTSDQTITSQPTLVNDNTLSVAVAANSTYSVRAHLIFDGPATNGVLLTFTGPSGSSADLDVSATNADPQPSVGTFGGTPPSCPLVGTAGVGSNNNGDVTGTFVTGANAGNFTLQWCQNASSGTATRRRAKSFVELRRIA